MEIGTDIEIASPGPHRLSKMYELREATGKSREVLSHCDWKVVGGLERRRARGGTRAGVP